MDTLRLLENLMSAANEDGDGYFVRFHFNAGGCIDLAFTSYDEGAVYGERVYENGARTRAVVCLAFVAAMEIIQ